MIYACLTLAASFTGACPNLDDDMRCGIYEERPTVCRISHSARSTKGGLVTAASMSAHDLIACR